MGVVASAPAKIILFGEHFVVYGEPAIVLAIDRKAYARVEKRDDNKLHLHSANLNLAGYFKEGTFTAEQGDAREAKAKFEPLRYAVNKVQEKHGQNVGLDININSTVPVGAGLGSSAAVVTAVTAATASLLNVNLTKEEIFRIAFEAEKVVHGTPSGIDPAISTFGGALFFQMDTGFKPLDIKMDIPLVIGDTGVERSTRVQVEKMRSLVEKYPRVAEPMMRVAREIVLRAMDALKEKDMQALGDLMNINHALLYGMGVSDESLEHLLNAARRAGAAGAKLTGAGGGGCMIALSKEEKLDQVAEAIQRAGGRTFVARKTDEGVKVEQV
ncbi:MAG: mevalonate kinase [Candidatus Bathyarchaeia archaeon]